MGGLKSRGKKKIVNEVFWKLDISGMPPVFIEAGSKSEILVDMRKKLKPDAFKEVSIERVSRNDMIKTYRQLIKDPDPEDEVKEVLQHSQEIFNEHCGMCGEQGVKKSPISKLFSHVKKLMKGKIYD